MLNFNPIISVPILKKSTKLDLTTVSFLLWLAIASLLLFVWLLLYMLFHKLLYFCLYRLGPLVHIMLLKKAKYVAQAVVVLTVVQL